jgi:hypothetical protein
MRQVPGKSQSITWPQINADERRQEIKKSDFVLSAFIGG